MLAPLQGYWVVYLASRVGLCPTLTAYAPSGLGLLILLLCVGLWPTLTACAPSGLLGCVFGITHRALPYADGLCPPRRTIGLDNDAI